MADDTVNNTRSLECNREDEVVMVVRNDAAERSVGPGDATAGGEPPGEEPSWNEEIDASAFDEPFGLEDLIKKESARRDATYKAYRKSILDWETVWSKEAYFNLPYACSKCLFKCSTKNELVEHMWEHEGKKVYRCDYCYYVGQLYDVNAHRRIHTGDRPFACDVCDYKATRLNCLKAHMRIHTGEKPFVCRECGFKFTQAGNLRVHMRIHNKEKPLSCEICDYKCSQPCDLRRHALTHTGERPFACDICAYRCNEASALTKHKRNHMGDKPHACQFCDYKTGESRNLRIHLRIHTGEKPFACSFCNYKCTQSSALQRHLRTHTGEKQYSCDFCDYKCIQAVHLKDHIRTHTGEKPYSCDLCDYSCIQPNNLKTHMRTHTGEKPHACSVCGLRFNDPGSMRRHMVIHSDDRPYACHLCDYKSKRPSGIKKHIKTHARRNFKLCGHPTAAIRSCQGPTTTSEDNSKVSCCDLSMKEMSTDGTTSGNNDGSSGNGQSLENSLACPISDTSAHLPSTTSVMDDGDSKINNCDQNMIEMSTDDTNGNNDGSSGNGDILENSVACPISVSAHLPSTTSVMDNGDSKINTCYLNMTEMSTDDTSGNNDGSSVNGQSLESSMACQISDTSAHLPSMTSVMDDGDSKINNCDLNMTEMSTDGTRSNNDGSSGNGQSLENSLACQISDTSALLPSTNSVMDDGVTRNHDLNETL